MSVFDKMKAKKMTPEAACREGTRLYDGGSQNRSFAYFESAAQRGHGAAAHMTSLCYKDGYGCREDRAQELYWMEKAAEHGVAKSQYLCGSMYYRGHGCRSDKQKALYWYEKAAQQAKPEHMYGSVAMYTCAISYEQGRGCQVDLQKALDWYEKCRDFQRLQVEDMEKKDYHEAMLRAQKTLDERQQDVDRVRAALGLEPETKQARPAPNTSVAKAQRMYDEGVSYMRFSPSKALYYFSQAAELGHPEGQYMYARMLLDGNACEKNEKLAARWFEKSAKQGNALAQRQLGILMLYGCGCMQSRAGAYLWFQKAAEQGNADAMYYLALLHIHTWRGTDEHNKTKVYLQNAAYRDHALARETLKMMESAGMGDPDAMYHLGMLIVKVGDPSDPFNQARFWLGRARDAGHISADIALRTDAKDLPIV